MSFCDDDIVKLSMQTLNGRFYNNYPVEASPLQERDGHSHQDNETDFTSLKFAFTPTGAKPHVTECRAGRHHRMARSAPP